MHIQRFHLLLRMKKANYSAHPKTAFLSQNEKDKWSMHSKIPSLSQNERKKS